MLDDRPAPASDDEVPALRPALLAALAKAHDGGEPYEPQHALPPKKDRTNAWLWLIVVLCSGFVGGTTAAFQASATDTGNVFGSASLSRPADQDVTLKGSEITLTNGALGAFDGSPSGVGYGSRWRYYWPTGVSSTGSDYGCDASTSTYTTDLADNTSTQMDFDYTTVNGFADGRWMCVMGHTAFPQAKPSDGSAQWYSQVGNPVDAVMLGHVIKSVDLQDGGGTVNTMQQGDRIVVNFNQAVDATGLPTAGHVCARGAAGRIYVGPAKADGSNPTPACSNTVAATKMFYLEAVGTTSVGTASFTNATWTWSNGNRTLTITLPSAGTVAINCTGGGCTRQWRVRMGLTLNPSTALESAATPTRSLCVATDNDGPDNGTCEPTASGSF